MARWRYAAVICDIDGVLRHWPAVDDLELAHGLAAGAIAAAAFAPRRLIPAITGQITDEQWRAAVTADLAETHGSSGQASAAVAAWSAMVPRTDPDVADLLRRVRHVTPVALLSNATTRLERDLEDHGLADVADLVVNSSRVGFAKPDHRAYLTAAEHVGATPDRCVFIDDTAANVDAATAVGMTAVLYRGIEDLRRALAPLLDPGGPSAP